VEACPEDIRHGALSSVDRVPERDTSVGHLTLTGKVEGATCGPRVIDGVEAGPLYIDDRSGIPTNSDTV